MSGAVLVIAIVGAFFVIGIAFGALAVIAGFSRRGGTARAARKRARFDVGDPGTGWTDPANTGWEEPPGSGEGGEDDPAPGPPRWTGGPAGR